MDAVDRPLRRGRRALPERVRDVRAGRHLELSVLLYDRDCGFCRTALALILGWDRRRALRPLALQDSEAESLLSGMSEAERVASFHLVTADGTVYSAGRALTELLRLLPGGRPVAAAAGAVQPLTDAAYRLVAGNRDRLGPLVPATVKRRATARIAARELGRTGGAA